MMTTLSTLEVEPYYERVRAALSGLPDDVRDDLLEDLPDHLAEVLAEGEGSLEDRLGRPEAYAEELRVAAGVDVPATSQSRRVHELLDRFPVAARRFDEQAGRLVGYPRLMDLLRAIRPGWWVLRGWIVAQFVAGTHDRATWHGFVPNVGGNPAAGFVLMAAAIVLSVWFGQRSVRFSDWPRRLTALASAIVAAWAVFVLAHDVGGTAYAYLDQTPIETPFAGQQASDVYVYDKNGNPVRDARLFDQDGNPIQVGPGVCSNGEQPAAIGADPNAPSTYPLCPADGGPFQSGPGPLTTSPSASIEPNSQPATGGAAATGIATPTSAPPAHKARTTAGH